MTRAMDEPVVTEDILRRAFSTDMPAQPDEVQDVDPAALDAEADPGSWSMEVPKERLLKMPKGQHFAPVYTAGSTLPEAVRYGGTLETVQGLPGMRDEDAPLFALICICTCHHCQGLKADELKRAPYLRLSVKDVLTHIGRWNRHQDRQEAARAWLQVAAVRLRGTAVRLGNVKAVNVLDVCEVQEVPCNCPADKGELFADSLYFRLSQTLIDHIKPWAWCPRAALSINQTKARYAWRMVANVILRGGINKTPLVTYKVATLLQSLKLAPDAAKKTPLRVQSYRVKKALETNLDKAFPGAWRYKQPNGGPEVARDAARALSFDDWASLVVEADTPGKRGRDA